MPESIEIVINGDEKDFIAAAKKVDAETKRLSDTLKKAGVSQSAYNQVVAKSNKALQEQAAAAGKSSGVFASVGNAIQGLVNPATLAVGALTAIGGVIKGSYGDFQNYAGAVRDLALVSGTGAEQSSLLLQVLDDFEISAEDVTVATKKMTANGLVPTVETLAQLSDQYLAIQDPMERNEFVLKNLGKAGLEWVNVLSQGSEALMKTSDEVNKYLILSDEQIKKAEQERLAMDALSDSWQGVKIQIGSAMGNLILWAQNEQTVTERAEELAKANGELGLTVENQSKYIGTAREQLDNEAHAMQHAADVTAYYAARTKESAEAQDVLQTALNGTSGSLEEISARNADLIKDAITIQKQQDDYKTSQEEILATIQELNDEKAKVRSWDKAGIEEVNKKIDEQKEKYAENTAAFVEAQTTKLAMMALEKVAMSDGVAGFSDAEAAKALAILDTADVAEEAAIREAIAFDKATSSIANGADAAANMKRLLDLMQKGYSIDVAVNFEANQNAWNQMNNNASQTGTGGFAPGIHAAGGSFIIPSAMGRSFMLPSSVGNEAFRMAGGHTASGNERITVTPQNKDVIDYKKLARVLRDTMAQAG